MLERIDLTRADDPRDVVHRAVACLARGGLVGLPSGSSYAIAANALDRSAVSGLGRWGPSPTPPTVLLRGAGEVGDWGVVASEVGPRLARRAWPGPMTLVLPVLEGGLADRLPAEARALVAVDGSIALRSPAHPMALEILRLFSGPLIEVTPPPMAGGQSPTADSMAGLDGLAMLLDAGTTRPGFPPTIVAVSGDAWSIVQPGAVPERSVARMAGTILLFVCTGNTCRSPMAEALCKAILARKLACSAEELVDRGYVVLSAGVAASDGMPAAGHAVDVVRDRGGSLDDHASRRAGADLVRQADHILAMTLDHLDILLDQVPDVAPKARLLDPGGDDIDDPVGSDRETYLRTARQIEVCLDRLIAELGL